MDRGKSGESRERESVCSGVGRGKMDHPTQRAINHCQREGEKWGEREGRREAGGKEKKKRAREDSSERVKGGSAEN